MRNNSNSIERIGEIIVITGQNQLLGFTVVLLLTSFPVLVQPKYIFQRFLVEFTFTFGFLILTTTVLNNVVWFLPLALIGFCKLLLSKQNRNGKIFKSLKSCQLMSPLKPVVLVRVLTNVYSNLMISVCVCILAVDFKVFPEHLAKTHIYGWSLMDVGTGCFIAMNGAISLEARSGLSSPQAKWTLLKKTFISTIPILALGCSRVVVIKAINYHEVVTEYGVHWNFFFTVAFTKLFSALFLSFAPKAELFTVAAVMGCLHQLVLHIGGASFIQNDDRTSLFAANKEGILSLPGYIAIYFTLVKVTSYGFKTKSETLIYLPFRKLTLASLALFLLMILVHFLIENVSRREANLPYVLWIVSLVLYYCILEFIFEVIRDVLHRIGVLPESPEFDSLIQRATAKNALFMFLTGNLLTGIINLSVDTKSVNNAIGVGIIFLYSFILGGISVICYTKNIKLKLTT